MWCFDTLNLGWRKPCFTTPRGRIGLALRALLSNSMFPSVCSATSPAAAARVSANTFRTGVGGASLISPRARSSSATRRPSNALSERDPPVSKSSDTTSELRASFALRPETWIKTTPAGLYCEPGDFHIDPLTPVPRAVITHGHADHARPGNERVLATPGTIAIMRLRYGEL